MKIANNENIWCGKYHVKPGEGDEDFPKEALGAYVTLLAISDTKEDFLRFAENIFAEYNMVILECEAVGLASEFELDCELTKAAQELSRENPFAFSTFHSYSNL